MRGKRILNSCKNTGAGLYRIILGMLFAVVLSEFGAFSSSGTATNVVKEYNIYVNGTLSDALKLGTVTDDIKLGSTP